MKTTENDQGSTTFCFSRKELESLLAHMSTDDTRPNLYALALDVDGRRAIATDGHRQVILQAGGGTLKSSTTYFLVPREAIEQVVKLATLKDEIEIEPHDDEVLTRVNGRNAIYKRADFSSPPYDAIVPSTTKLPADERTTRVTAQGFSAAYLVDIATIVDACPPLVTIGFRGKKEKHYPHVELRSGNTALDPLVAIIECPANYCRWTVVLMPVRA